MIDEENIIIIKEFAKKLRLNVLNTAYATKGKNAHLGGALSMCEILAVLFSKVMDISVKNFSSQNRDKFILSKGHSVLSYYAALKELGFISEEELLNYEGDNTFLFGHPVRNLNKGIEFSTGSLGMGLSIGIGIALAKNHLKLENRVYVILGDGECNEGSIWEGAMAASKFKLQNLRVIIDKNNYQQTGSTEEIMPNKNLGNKFDQFGWNVNEVDGHNIKDLYAAIIEDKLNEKPTVIVANTIKGKGVEFFENDNKWHHNLLTKVDYENAIKEVLK